MHRIHDLVAGADRGSGCRRTSTRRFHARVFAAFQQELEPVDGVAEVLEKLAADGVPYCVASSGSHERIRVGHRKTGLDQWFEEERIFSAQDVGRGKPAPDLFLHAASGWECRPSGVSSSRTARSGCRRPGRGDGRVRVHGDDARRPARRGDRAASPTWLELRELLA